MMSDGREEEGHLIEVAMDTKIVGGISQDESQPVGGELACWEWKTNVDH